MTLRKDKIWLSFVAILIALLIGPTLNIFLLLIVYYCISLFVYIIAIIRVDARYYSTKRKSKRLRVFISESKVNFPEPIVKFTKWLEDEGFLVKVYSDDKLYLESKTVKINIFTTLKGKDTISILSARAYSNDFKIYKDDEELKIMILEYIVFLSDAYKKFIESVDRFNNLNPGSSSFLAHRDSFNQTFKVLCIRVQGYLFLIIAFLNIQSDDFSYFYRVLIILAYTIIETIL